MEPLYPLDSRREAIEAKFRGFIHEEPHLNSSVSYVGNRKIPFLRLYRYKEAFAYGFVEQFLRRFSIDSNDYVFDPFAGTGTTLVVAHQLQRNSIGIEIDPENVEIVKLRLQTVRPADNTLQYLHYYRFTPNLTALWPIKEPIIEQRALFDV